MSNLKLIKGIHIWVNSAVFEVTVRSFLVLLCILEHLFEFILKLAYFLSIIREMLIGPTILIISYFGLFWYNVLLASGSAKSVQLILIVN